MPIGNGLRCNRYIVECRKANILYSVNSNGQRNADTRCRRTTSNTDKYGSKTLPIS